MNADCPAFRAVVEELDRSAPGVPLLALGQTVFWDEPMKAGVFAAFQACGSARPVIAGVHDTDYFAKYQGSGQGFAALPRNDTTTRDLWSAAGEFSSLFGSETVITKEKLVRSGAKVHLLESERHGILTEITEAYGWRGLASLSRESITTAEKPLGPIFPHVYSAFQWALDESLNLIAGRSHTESEAVRDSFLAMLCDARDQTQERTLAGFYESLIPRMFESVLGRSLELGTTRTTKLLRFNRETCRRPRFEVVDLFLNPASRDAARDSYNHAVARSEIYTLDRFGAGALPFDLYIPGVGRGTLRLGTRGGLVMTDDPVGFSFKGPIESVAQLAEIIERKFGPDCVLIGKAVTLILMLAREYVFVFQEGASSYVWRSREMANHLAERGHPISLHPILRTQLASWDALDECNAWINLPEPMRRPFGTTELNAPNFALRWREVVRAQQERLRELSLVRRPLALLGYLQAELGGQWTCLSAEYESIANQFHALGQQIEDLKAKKRALAERIARNAEERDQLQKEKGEQFRAKIFEKSASASDLAERERIIARIDELDAQRQALREEYRELEKEQKETVRSQEILHLRERRSNIALEAEIMRARLIREAVICSTGLERAGFRPSAWWFPLLSPSGEWFRRTMHKTVCRLEPLCP